MSPRSSAGVDRESLMYEKYWLLKFIEWYSLALGPNEMAISLGKYLGCGDVPWLRMYDPFPDWQQQSGLLTDELHTDVVGTPVLVFCTLTMPRNRKALGGARVWENKGAPKPKAESLHFDMTKLYYPKDGANKRKEDGFTVTEFALKNQKVGS
ncbi:uncharacterized protein LOC123425370 [Hordeum vulgare subsp. vulgare]|uniref:uncharacterized protein LOC123425370 n=1 Tax=Hordeum vulgare subsp. vulgare TaxID=112509 RepID=UPI001D1A5216|nr:uncharacterized protein LOC123425370 [Hordeum vulgare subsp. vulgare]